MFLLLIDWPWPLKCILWSFTLRFFLFTLQRKKKVCTPGDEAIMKIHKKLFSGIPSHFLLYLQNYKEFEAEILDLQSEKYGLSFDIKKYTISGWALGDENVIGIRAFKAIFFSCSLFHINCSWLNWLSTFECNPDAKCAKIAYSMTAWIAEARIAPNVGCNKPFWLR